MSHYGKKRRGGNGKDRAAFERDATELERRWAETCTGEAASCGKVRYRTRTAAVNGMGETAAKDGVVRGGMNGQDGHHRLSVYRCEICAGRPYHFGHTPASKRKR